MGQRDADGKKRKLIKLWLAFAICFLFNMLTISVVGYGAFYTYEKFERMQEANDELRHEVDTIKKVILSPKTLPPCLALSMIFLFYFWSWLYWGEATSLTIDPLLEEIFLEYEWGWCVEKLQKRVQDKSKT